MKKFKDMIFIDGPWFKITKNGKQKWMRADFVSEEELETTLAKKGEQEESKAK